MPGVLYIVATPIGNLQELTPRALQILSQADIIAAEDTRTSRKLLDRYGIQNRPVSHHQFNQEGSADALVDKLLAGQSVAMISDAGTPCISDPGAWLVQRAVQQGVEVVGVSGACALAVAMSISGFLSTSFFFGGFLPREKKEMMALLTSLQHKQCPVAIFYQSPRRIAVTMRQLAACLPDAAVCLCNDLTKKFERIYRGTPEQVLLELMDNPAHEKGEYTLVIEIPKAEDKPQEGELTLEAQLVERMARHDETLKEAVANLSDAGLPRNALYQASLRLKERFDS